MSSMLLSPDGKSIGVRKGCWTEEEDELLRQCVDKYGEGSWHQVPLRAGLNRCRKSCRLRWLNYLKPNIKRGQFTADEVDLLVRLHKLLGNRWSLIAGRLPGRTANDVKNYWNTRLSKKSKPSQNLAAQEKTIDTRPPPSTTTPIKPRPRTFKKTPSWPTMTREPLVSRAVEQPLTSIEPADDTSTAWWESLLLLEEERERVCSTGSSASGPEPWAGSMDGLGSEAHVEGKFLSLGDVNGLCDLGDDLFADVGMWDDVLVPQIDGWTLMGCNKGPICD